MGAAYGKKIGLTGLSLADIKKYSSIIPIYGIMVAGVSLAMFYGTRLATQHPEVMWKRHSNPEPWNKYDGKQYKFLNMGRDYKEPSQVPKYKD